MVDALIRFANNLKPLNEQEQALMRSCVKPMTIRKNEIILDEGATYQGMYFVSKGSLRTYYLKDDGKEVTTGFYLETDCAVDFESINNKKPTKLVLQALEDSDIILIYRDKLMGLYNQAPVFETTGRIILEQMLAEMNKYAQLLNIHNPKERYEYIEANKPELLQRIPLQHLATYLGMARETLSRVRTTK